MRNALSDDEIEAAKAASRDADFGPWSQVEFLLAEIHDRIAHLSWQTQGKEHAPLPLPYPRPGVNRRGNVHAINPVAEAWLREVERLHGATPAPDWQPELG